jgi:hypothetical protein
MRTDQLRTNRDLALFVAELRHRYAAADRDLERYLTALRHLGSNHRTASAISLECFATLIEAAFTAPVPVEPPPRSVEKLDEGFRTWGRTIRMQIVDLHEMRESGTLANDQRYFGVDSPRGSRWYNFDPLTFLECAVAGTFGEEDDPVFEIAEVSWEKFAGFLSVGQSYE